MTRASRLVADEDAIARDLLHMASCARGPDGRRLVWVIISERTANNEPPSTAVWQVVAIIYGWHRVDLGELDGPGAGGTLG